MRLKVSERRSRGGRNGDRIDAREAPRSRDDRGSRRARRAMGTRPRETVERESRRPRTCGSSGVCGGPGHPRFAGKTEFATPRRGEVRGRRARCRNRPRPREVLGFFRGSDRERGRVRGRRRRVRGRRGWESRGRRGKRRRRVGRGGRVRRRRHRRHHGFLLKRPRGSEGATEDPRPRTRRAWMTPGDRRRATVGVYRVYTFSYQYT